MLLPFLSYCLRFILPTRYISNDKEWKDSDVLFYISPAYCSQFHPDDWWKHRADSRTFFYEFSKIIWYAFAE